MPASTPVAIFNRTDILNIDTSNNEMTLMHRKIIIDSYDSSVTYTESDVVIPISPVK